MIPGLCPCDQCNAPPEPACADCGCDGVRMHLVSVVSRDGHGSDPAYIHLCDECHALMEIEGEEQRSEHPPRSTAFGGPGFVTTRAA